MCLREMKIGIMQPYFLPYIGYFALINAVDKFVYFDNVQNIKRGWVNRNRIKMRDKWIYITLPIKNASLSAKINEITIVNNRKSINKIKETIRHCYSKAPNYNPIKEIVFKYIISGDNLSLLNINLTNEICDYLDIKTEKFVSSEILNDNALSGEEKIIKICKTLGGNHYINPIGGTELYSKERFKMDNLSLSFLKMSEISYFQGNSEFIPNLSIIDLLMFIDKNKIIELLNCYELV